ncbi:MAG: Lrp/AsnC ligand binding domain-containing protein [Nanopusillaceae archaeon]|jgi:anthranilate phosphoribosyltransferase
MITAYILVNVKPGKENVVLEGIKKSQNNIKILESSVVYGEYDVIVKIEGETLEEIRKFVLDKIRSLDFVERTVTLISAE